MRLDKKPYEGEPITLSELASDEYRSLVNWADETGDSVQLVLDNGRYPKLPSTTPIGYDAICPDWRERLERVLTRMATSELAIREDIQRIGDNYCPDCEGKLEAMEAAAQVLMRNDELIRREFGIEEESP